MAIIRADSKAVVRSVSPRARASRAWRSPRGPAPRAAPSSRAVTLPSGASASGKPHEVPRRLRSRRQTAAISGPQAGAEAARVALEAAVRKEPMTQRAPQDEPYQKGR